MDSPRSSPSSRPSCSRSAASGLSVARSFSSPAATQPDGERGVLRRTRRHQPGRRLQRATAAAPPQPRRRPPTQLGAPRHRPRPHPPPPTDRRLPRTAARQGQNRTRSTPLRQTRPRPPLLPTPAHATHTHLDNIEASGFIEISASKPPRISASPRALVREKEKREEKRRTTPLNGRVFDCPKCPGGLRLKSRQQLKEHLQNVHHFFEPTRAHEESARD
jgi:hypothetical protein